MQRSRKALLNRRALMNTMTGRYRFYTVSLSLIFLWALLFIFTFWIRHGDGHQDSAKADELSFGLTTWEESKLECKPFNSVKDMNFIRVSEASNRKETKLSISAEAQETEGISKMIFPSKNLPDLAKPITATEGSSKEVLASENRPEMEKPITDTKLESVVPKTRSVPLGLDEFKSKSFSAKSKYGNGQPGGIKHRTEPGGKEYNYASASKGAKVLDFNKESKGASNILGRDKDKYLRNPCSAEEKFVVIELSEETLVDEIEIANFEHYSSNIKEFELLGSLVYPTNEWVKLRNITAGNVKLAQRFVLPEPKWVRYLKLNILSHYGSEFYCTVSTFEVYGVDAVERMLEDLISIEAGVLVADSAASADKKKTVLTQSEPLEGDDLDQDISNEENGSRSLARGSILNLEIPKSDVPDPVEEVRHHQQVGRVPGDTALKILMQKVRSLDLNLSVLERYLEELTSKYGKIFKEIDRDIGEADKVVEKIRMDVQNLLESHRIMAEDVNSIVAWKSFVSLQMENMLRDNAILRHEVEKVKEKQISMDNKNVTMFVVCVSFALLAIVRIFAETAASVYRSEPKKFCSISSSWLFLLFSCIFTFFILSL